MWRRCCGSFLLTTNTRESCIYFAAVCLVQNNAGSKHLITRLLRDTTISGCADGALSEPIVTIGAAALADLGVAYGWPFGG
jgi:hypothetical protein